MEHRLEVRSLCKSFPGVRALADVSLTLVPGELHAIVGENGAGKSTLMKILAGALAPDSGSIWLRGRQVHFQTPRQARDAGISIIYQELALAPNLSVAENLFLGREPRWLPGVLSLATMRRKAAEVLAELGVLLDVNMRVGDLTVAQQQLVEIGRALASECDVLILDEPTATLTDHEIEGVFAMIASLRRRGVSILYISHRLEEIFRLADRISVLKDGRLVTTLDRHQTSRDELIRLMVGREITEVYPPRTVTAGEVALSVRGLTARDRFHDVSWELRRGEVLGLFGLIGAGRSELARAIIGGEPLDSGEMALHGHPYRPRSPGEALAGGVALVSENRKVDGLLLGMSVRENVSLANLPRMHRAGMLDRAAERKAATDGIARLGIKARDAEQATGLLSGGNQQKVMLARSLLVEPSVLILDEPTRGVDVGAKAEIYAIIRQLADDGVAVLVISSDLPEVLGLSDRVLVMRSGKLVGVLPGGAGEDEAMLLAAHTE